MLTPDGEAPEILLLSTSTHVFLALFPAVGLTPLAAAHMCTPGLVSIDRLTTSPTASRSSYAS